VFEEVKPSFSDGSEPVDDCSGAGNMAPDANLSSTSSKTESVLPLVVDPDPAQSVLSAKLGESLRLKTLFLIIQVMGIDL